MRLWLARIILPCSGILTVLALWEIGGRIMGDALFAPVSSVAPEYLRLVRDGVMLRELAMSLQQMLIGFGLALLVGIPLGTLMGRSQLADAIFQPWVSMLIVTSVAALVPLFIMLFGTGLAFRVAVVFMASAWYVVITVYHGARGIDPRFIDVAQSFAAGRWLFFTSVLLPALFPYLITATRVGIVHAIRAMVVAEMFVIVGYGALIHKSGLDVSTAPMLGLLITLMAVSMAASALLRVAGRLSAPWYDERTAQGQ